MAPSLTSTRPGSPSSACCGPATSSSKGSTSGWRGQPVRQPGRNRPPDLPQRGRARLGRQRGVAARRRGRHLRRLPSVVRAAVQRLLPGAVPRPAGPHRPGRLLRVPGQDRRPRGGGGPGTSPTSPAAWCRRSSGAPRSPTSSTGVPLSPGGHYYGGLIGLLHPIALVGGLASLALFAFHGSRLPRLKTSGAFPARPARGRLAGVAAGVLLAAAVVWVAAAGRPAVAGRVCPAPCRWCSASLAVAAVARRHGLLVVQGRDGWAFVATGRGHPRGDGGGVRPDVPGRAAGEQPGRQRPDHRGRRLAAQHPGGHDGRRRHLHPLRPRLPGLDLLGLPPASPRPPGRRPRRPPPRS